MMQALTDSQLDRIKALHRAIAEVQADNARLQALLDGYNDDDDNDDEGTDSND